MEEKNGNGDELFVHKEIIVDPGQRPLRIDKFLMDRLERVSRNKVQHALRAGAIRVDGKEVKPNFKVLPNQVISVVLSEPPKEGSNVLPEDIPIKVVYEDDYLMIVDKAAGMVVHPGIGNHSGTLVNALAHHLKKSDLPVLPGNMADRPGLVHRIDKDTSGLLVIAKDDYAMTSLAKQFFDHTIDRSYLALVWGEPDDQKGTIDVPIGRHPKERLLMHAFEDGESGKPAVTHYEVVEGLYYVSLIKCVLETGRTHQIRVHMKHLGHPIFNDSRYGGDRVVKGTVFSKYRRFVENCFNRMPRQALHANTLGFVHPVTGKRMEFESPLPDDFEEVMNRWRTYVSDRRSKLDI